MFKFLDYSFKDGLAAFRYQGADDVIFTEKVLFKLAGDYNTRLFDKVLKLAWFLIGTSYYKARPTKNTNLQDLSGEQARFLNAVYQEGLSQFAFENNLTREDLAHFEEEEKNIESTITYAGRGQVVLQSGGKDSLLNATLLEEQGAEYTPIFISTDGNYPAVLDKLKYPVLVITREIDLLALKKSGGLNGHVPVTYINQTLALLQAILLNKNTVLTSIGREGEEAHAEIGDLKINHQWSKTATAEKFYQNYLAKLISPDLVVKSPLRNYRELEIAELFAKKCWQKYGREFSSCNVANYQQGHLVRELSWCGHCAKCANSYLLFSPFVEAKEQQALFGGDLFTRPELTEDFKGLLGVDNVMKPFECVGEVAELREAYKKKLPGYGNLSFKI